MKVRLVGGGGSTQQGQTQMSKITLSILSALLVSGAAVAQQGSTPPSIEGVAKSASVEFVAQQQSGDRLASEIRGSSVRNGANETLGSVSDLLMSADNKVTAIVVGVGGFLGIGATDVAVKAEAAKITKDKEGALVVQVDANREQLSKAPKFVTLKASEDASRASTRPASPPGGTK